eukprot:scaffold24076_cov101-Isochrysis_galbana.AAC.1
MACASFNCALNPATCSIADSAPPAAAAGDGAAAGAPAAAPETAVSCSSASSSWRRRLCACSVASARASPSEAPTAVATPGPPEGVLAEPTAGGVPVAVEAATAALYLPFQ